MDVLELEFLVSHASSLKALILDAVRFKEAPARRVDPVSHKALVVLDSLKVDFYHMGADAVDAILSAFATLDIRHLRTLNVLKDTPFIPMLKVKARTL
jgi:hypothetical protein